VFHDNADEDFGVLCDRLLDMVTPEEARAYGLEWCKHWLPQTAYRVMALMPDIMGYLIGIFESAHPIHGNAPLPALPHSKMPDKGDFLLGCYWVLMKSRRFVLDYNRFLHLNEPDPGEKEHMQAVLRYSSADLVGARTAFPQWPWLEAVNPFYE